MTLKDIKAAAIYVEKHGLIGGNHGAEGDDELFERVFSTITKLLTSALEGDMVLVPREPSNKMIEAGYQTRKKIDGEGNCEFIYKAMIAAAGKEG